MTPEEYRVDVRSCVNDLSQDGYPKYAKDQLRAHALAECAANELDESAPPGEYMIAVTIDGKTPIATQVVIVPNRAK